MLSDIMSVVAVKSILMYLWLFATIGTVAVLGLGWAEEVPSNSGATGIIRLRRLSSSTSSSCVVPPQPINGQWKLHRLYCDQDVDCDIPQGFGAPSGSQLVYTCDLGYKLDTDTDVYCTARGYWSVAPKCVEIKCGSLNSDSRVTICYRSDEGVDCDSSVLPETRAQVSCRPGYKKDSESLLEQGETVVCNQWGRWIPEPIRCEPAEGIGWNQDDANYNNPTGGSPHERFPPSIGTSTPTCTTSAYPCTPRVPVRVAKTSCPAPPQPANGEWRIRQDFCDETFADCKVPEGTELGLSYELVYSCGFGYKADGTNVVYCRRTGNWSRIPTCVEIKCGVLNSVSRIAQCSRSRKTVSCDFPVLPWTQAIVSCRPGYREDTTLLTPRRNVITCSENGEWEPSPIRCIPVCGQAATHRKPLVIDGSNAIVSDFPWHVSLYKQKSAHETKKYFVCGATLIQTNVLLTAAHCVYDERFRSAEDPRKLFVMTGNVFRDWDDARHDYNIVRKSIVKRVYLHYTYHGLPGNYASDIALLELEQPFVFSEILLPACLDTTGYSAPFLDPGVYGRIAGFGRTTTGASSSVLQTIMVPYISYSECKMSRNAAKNEVFITKDKFCAGYTNGSAVCEGDSGGGLVFQKNELWYVLGVVSVGLGVDLENGETTCERYSYTLYTRVSEYTEWILGVISDMKERTSNLSSSPVPQSYATTSVTASVGFRRNPGSSNTRTTTAPFVPTRKITLASVKIPTSSNPPGLSSCSVPPQPANGEWKLDKSFCHRFGLGTVDCYISQGVELEPDSHLVFSCNSGYRARGSTDVYCRPGGNWTSFPVCVETKCSTLNSTSTIADCVSRLGDWISCDSSVPPGTRAQITCRSGYKRDTSSVSTSRETVLCNANGKWKPDPIRCTPVCGRATNHETPLQLGSISSAKVGDFPWHASVYYQRYTTKGIKRDFICGATLIRVNLLLIAAHCVYDERTKTTIDPTKLFVMMGNVYRDYDSPQHNKQTVRKGAVKNVYRNCQYYGITGKFASDIALLELQESFQLSETLLPACLDVEADSVQILDAGAFGRIPGFGKIATSSSNGILQAITMAYVPYNQCRRSNGGTGNGAFIGHDKFCARHINETGVSEGDGGGGLVFKKNDLWYVLGVASVGISGDVNDGDKALDRYSYSLYTRVSDHLGWIQKVIFELEQYNSYPSCDPDQNV